MEKISLYDLLSILLPGAILTLVIDIIIRDLGVNIEKYDFNQYFSLTIFLTSSIFLGSAINIITRVLLEKVIFFKFLYKPISEIYLKNKQLDETRSFYDKKIKKLSKKINLKEEKKNEKKKDVFYDSIESIWSEAYFYLESNEKIAVPKNFQSFYFFFRNFFLVGIVLFPPLIALFFYKGYDFKYMYLLIIDAFSLIISVLAGRWNRVKMVERVLWAYYSLTKKD